MLFPGQTTKSEKRAASAVDCAEFRSFGGEARQGHLRGHLIGSEQLGWRGYSETWRRT
jgi:hypothetical protein